MKVDNKYVVGCLVMWYEIEMFPEYIDSCLQMMKDVENPENVIFDICFNLQEYLENIDRDLSKPSDLYFLEKFDVKQGYFLDILDKQLSRLNHLVSYPDINVKLSCKLNNHDFYNIAAYRRDLNYNYCNKVDFVLWGETDSLWPKQTFEIIEQISKHPNCEPKFILNFAGRKNWDKSWDEITHPMFANEQFVDNDNWVLGNEASEKSYMTLERMNEINNIPPEQITIHPMNYPKADGSCLVISSDLIKSGVNIPHALIHCGEDESFMRMAKLIMGDQFVQYNVKNILRVHNRRHPKKRMYIKGENNPKGFCDERKGAWWKILEDSSKKNLENLRKQIKFIKNEEVLSHIKNIS